MFSYVLVGAGAGGGGEEWGVLGDLVRGHEDGLGEQHDGQHREAIEIRAVLAGEERRVVGQESNVDEPKVLDDHLTIAAD